MRDLLVRITGDASGLRGALRNASGDLDRFEGKTKAADRGLRGLATYGIAAVALGATVLAGGLTAAGAAAITFDANMRNVQSITKQSDDSLAELNEQVLALASSGLPARAGDLSEGLYDIASSGFQGAAGLKILEAAAQAASAGMTTTETAAGAISASLNAYGLSATEAGDVSDILFRTVDQGVITFEGLSKAIGFTVGTAASAGIELDELSAALATITLSGQKGEIAQGSLAATIRSVAVPTKELAALYERMGYASSEAAIEALGLEGIVRLIGESSGGSLQNMQTLLGSVESVRGVSALLANNGETYARVAGQITDADARMGATQAALDEQSKSTRFQFERLVATFEAGAIRVGLQVLPVFNGILAAMLDVVDQGGPALLNAMSRLEPTFTALYGAGVNVVTILGALWRAVEPVAGALAGLAATGVVGLLQGLTSVLEGTTGVLEENQELVIAVAAVYLGSLVPAVAASAATMTGPFLAATARAAAGLALVRGGALNVVTASLLAQGALTRLAGSLLTVQAAATAGAAIAIYALVRGMAQLEEASTKAEEKYAGAMDGINAADTSAVEESLASLRADMEASNATYEELQEKWRTPLEFRVNAGINAAFGDGSVADAAMAGAEAAEAYAQLSREAANADANLASMADTTGLSVGRLRQLAIANDIDLSKPIADSGPEREELLLFLSDLEEATGTPAEVMLDVSDQGMEELAAAQEAAIKFQDTVRDSFEGATDVISKWRPDIGVQELETASDRVAAAQERIEEIKARSAGSDEEYAARARDLAAAEEELSDARVAALEAESAAAEGTLAGFYAARIQQAADFSNNITEALARGLDPAYVSELMAQGPEAAGPILEEILSDSSGALIAMVNESEAQLSELGAIMVEQARLTNLAINDENNQRTQDLAVAMQISRAVMVAEGQITAAEVAESLKIPQSEVERIGASFGVGFMSSAQAAINARKLTIPDPVRRSAVNRAGIDDGRNRPGYSTGGRVAGQGTGTSDSIPALLSHGEYVQPAATVNYYGEAFMERVRTRQLPRFAEGGLAGNAQHSAGRVQVVEVPVTHTSETRAPIYVGTVVTNDADSFRRDSLARSTRGAAE